MTEAASPAIFKEDAIFTENIASFPIEMPPEIGELASASINLTYGPDDKWHGGFESLKAFESADGNGHDIAPGTIPVNSPSFDDAAAAFYATSLELFAWWNRFGVTIDDKLKVIVQTAQDYVTATLDSWGYEVAEVDDPTAVAVEALEPKATVEPEPVAESQEEPQVEVAKVELDDPNAEEHHEQQLLSLQSQLTTACVLRSQLAVQLKNAKKRIDSLTDQLEEILESGPERMPLFDKKVDDVEEEVVEEEVTVSSDEWRAVPLTTTKISPGTLAVLRDNPEKTLTTIGDLADRTDPLTAIPKVGPSKATEIEDAMVMFWAENPQYTRDGESVNG